MNRLIPALLRLLAHERAPITAIATAAAVTIIQSWHEGHPDWPLVAVAALTTAAAYTHSPVAAAIVNALGCKIVPHNTPFFTYRPGEAPVPAPDPCRVPPPGWMCTRPAGHEGPCAAWPVEGAPEPGPLTAPARGVSTQEPDGPDGRSE